MDTDALAPLFADAVDGILPVSKQIRGRLLELNAAGEIPIFGGPWINRFFHDGMVSINLLREATDARDPATFRPHRVQHARAAAPHHRGAPPRVRRVP